MKKPILHAKYSKQGGVHICTGTSTIPPTKDTVHRWVPPKFFHYSGYKKYYTICEICAAHPAVAMAQLKRVKDV